MQHPYEALEPHYQDWVDRCVIRPEVLPRVTRIAEEIVAVKTRFARVSALTGIVVPWMGGSFYREADLDFSRSPAQGDPWNRRSTHVPKGLGPYRNWDASALVAYHIDGTDLVGRPNWTMARGCYEAENLNGWGYNLRGEPTPYVVGGTNLQEPGRFVADHDFEAGVMDQQIGVLPIMMEVVRLDASLAFDPAWRPATAGAPAPKMVPVVAHPVYQALDVKWLQASLDKIDPAWELAVDGVAGRATHRAVLSFQRKHGLEPDGVVGPKTIAAIEAKIKAA